MLSPAFAGELFGPGPGAGCEHFIVLPDAIGHGKIRPTAPPIPRYNYDDMVAALQAGDRSFGIRHVRLVLGNSLGGIPWICGNPSGHGCSDA